MMNRFETYCVACYAYFTAKTVPILKTLGKFENLVFVIMSTSKNILIVARTYCAMFLLFFWALIYTLFNKNDADPVQLASDEAI